MSWIQKQGSWHFVYPGKAEMGTFAGCGMPVQGESTNDFPKSATCEKCLERHLENEERLTHMASERQATLRLLSGG